MSTGRTYLDLFVPVAVFMAVSVAVEAVVVSFWLFGQWLGVCSSCGRGAPRRRL